MKKFLVLIALFITVGSSARAQTNHDVLACSSGDWAWYAHVTKSTSNNPVETPASNEQTELFVRHSGPGEPWRPLPTLSGRAIALASGRSQLAVLMNDSDGQWLTVWSDGSSTGQALPAGGKMKTLADDGSDLWAVGSVNGGIAAADQALRIEMASTAPSTAPVLAMPATMPTLSAPTPGLVLFHQVNARWATVSELPRDQMLSSEDDLTLSVVGGRAMISFRTADGRVRTMGYTADHVWRSIASVRPATTQPIKNFHVLSDGFKPMLWITTGNSPGELFTDALEGTGGTSVKLAWPGVTSLDSVPNATFAGGYVCVFGLHGDKVLEQRYRSNGAPIETPAELVVPEPNEGLVPHWLEAVLLAFMGFSVGAKVFRQWLTGDKVPDAETPAPAPLLPRFIAGLIDALPVIAAVIVLIVQTDSTHDQGDLPTARTLIILGIALAFYLLHTTVAELLTGRSAGKWLLGLKVVTLEGKSPSLSQFLMRNLLRIVDPLVMIIFSPLRQRDADTVANTMVVRVGVKPAGTSTNGMTESGADKTDSH